MSSDETVKVIPNHDDDVRPLAEIYGCEINTWRVCAADTNWHTLSGVLLECSKMMSSFSGSDAGKPSKLSLWEGGVLFHLCSSAAQMTAREGSFGGELGKTREIRLEDDRGTTWSASNLLCFQLEHQQAHKASLSRLLFLGPSSFLYKYTDNFISSFLNLIS